MLEHREPGQEHFARFLKKRVENLERLALDDMKFNVLALRATATLLELDTPESLLRYRLAQHLERGLVTALGTTLQAVAKEIAGQGSGVAGADIEKIRDGRRYFIQVKSGPDTANKDIAQNIASLLNSARARDPEAICLLGVCYGRADQISGIVEWVSSSGRRSGSSSARRPTPWRLSSGSQAMPLKLWRPGASPTGIESTAS